MSRRLRHHFDLKPASTPGGAWMFGPLFKFNGADGQALSGAPVIRADRTIFGISFEGRTAFD